MKAINPYLHFKDNTEEAFNFYKSVLGGDFAMMMKFKDMPPEHQGPAEEAERVMHVSYPAGVSILMGSDTPGNYPAPNVGNNFSLSITADSKEEADKLYKGLSAGGKETMPMADAFWGSYFGMLKDKFDINWMISFDKPRN